MGGGKLQSKGGPQKFSPTPPGVSDGRNRCIKRPPSVFRVFEPAEATSKAVPQPAFSLWRWLRSTG